jgi:hypothetical protein
MMKSTETKYVMQITLMYQNKISERLYNKCKPICNLHETTYDPMNPLKPSGYYMYPML